MPVSIRIEGIEELERKLDPRRYQEAMKAGLSGAAEIVRDAVAEYPPSTAANMAPGVNGYSWYERGFGTRTITGLGYATSQALGRSWTTKVRPMQAVVGTRATYARYVQDRKHQATFHKARGWKTIQDVAEQKGKEVVAFFRNLIQKVIEKG